MRALPRPRCWCATGETIVIGGLIQTNDEERSTKVPLLGDLPVVGGLFKSYRYNRIKTELLMILTPKVIRSGKESAAQDLLRQLTRDEIERTLYPILDDGGLFRIYRSISDAIAGRTEQVRASFALSR
ncbi:MAG: type II and III secretion system protein [Richelia sp. CSU_2_1]|nr:type II and III secretion system protein [Richelia sp. CSU_2_1]